MKHLATLLAATALAGTATAAAPPRETGLDIATAQSIETVAHCIENRLGQFDEEPLEHGGLSIEYGAYHSLLIHTQATLYFDIVDDGQDRHIMVRYRHPMSKGTAAKYTRIIGRKCFPYELEAAGGGKL